MDITSIAIIAVGSTIGGIIYQMRLKNGDFDDFGQHRRFWTRVGITILFAAIPSFGYDAWKANGFQRVDARDAERTMERRYIREGAAQAEAHFIVTSRSAMSGYVDVKMPNGTRQTLACKAEKGESAEYLISCKP